MAKIFSLMGEIFIDNEKANKSIDTTTEKGKKSSESFTSSLGKITKSAVGIGTAVVGGTAAVVTGITALASKTADTSKEIQIMSERVGFNTTQYQEWDYIAKQNGTTMDTLQGGITDLAEKMDDAKSGTGEAAEIFNRLGLSVTDANGKLKNQNQMFEETMIALQGVTDETERQALATKLMSTTGEELLPLLNSQAGAISELKNEAHEMGIILSEEGVSSGAKFAETLTTIKQSVGGIFNQLFVSLMPILQVILDMIIQNMPLIQSMISTLTPIITELLNMFLPLIKQLIEFIFPVLIELINMLMPIIMTIIDLILPIIIDLLIILLPPLMQIIEALLPALIPIIEALVPIIKPVLELLSFLISTILIPLLPIFTSIIEILSKSLVVALKILTPIIEAVGKIFQKVFGGLFNIVKIPINNIISGLNNFISYLNRIKIPDWVPAVGGLGISLPFIPKLRVGMEYVPYDDMPALLHKGETVLTADEADDYRQNKSNKGNIVNNYNNYFTVEKMEVKEESDIKKIARELYYLFKKEGGKLEMV